MARIGVRIPPGLTITTEVCQDFYRVGKSRQAESEHSMTGCACFSCM